VATTAATRFRADQVGSYLRPPHLRQGRAAWSAGSISQLALRRIEDAAIDDLLARQRTTGIDVLTDGEFRRSTFLADLTSAVEGFESVPLAPNASSFFAADRSVERTVLAVTGRLRQRRRLADVELSYLRQHAPGPFKITLPTPFQFLNYADGVSDRVYATRTDLLSDLAEIISGEVRALIDDGARYVQIDAPRYSYFIDPLLAARFKSSGADPGVSLEQVLEADNLSLGISRSADVILAIHLCRGNNRSTWYASGGYEPIAEQMFSTLQADRFLLEFDDERSGSFAPLRYVPPGKVVVLGLVTTKFDQLETQETLLRRIDEAARYLPLEQLALSPQCGFASLLEGNAIDPDTQWRKLDLVVDTARRVWG
jgi:5-methyltetrahydropteroyltriglutamate--homocysteine methyltransferase